MDLRGRLIRLAYHQPTMRSHLLPLLKKAAVGLPPTVLLRMLQTAAPRGDTRVSITPSVVQAGMKWTAAVARALSVWQQRHTDTPMGVLMEDAPEVFVALLEGDRRRFNQWGDSVMPDTPLKPLAQYVEKALRGDFRQLQYAVGTP